LVSTAVKTRSDANAKGWLLSRMDRCSWYAVAAIDLSMHDSMLAEYTHCELLSCTSTQDQGLVTLKPTGATGATRPGPARPRPGPGPARHTFFSGCNG
jgi:hypothetical protein